jgi:hypothetical protein
VPGIRLLLVIFYIGYLVQAGLLMVYLPWSDAWGLLLLRLPPAVALFLDSPAIRGAVTAFGLLHLGLVAVEFVLAAPRRHRAPTRASNPNKTKSQNQE